MNIFFDTNVLDKIDLRHDLGFKKMVEYCQTYDRKIYLSDVVFLELVHHRMDEVETIERFLDAWNVKFRAVTGEVIRTDLPKVDVKVQLAEVLHSAGVILVTNEALDIGLVIEAMYTGRKPAKGRPGSAPSKSDTWDSHYSQSGMKDVFIWRSFLRLVQAHPQESFAFVSKNIRDFVDKQGRSDKHVEQMLLHSFHPHLREDLGHDLARIVCLNDIHAVRQLHINPIDAFDEVKALDLLSGGQGILADVFSEIGQDSEPRLARVEAVISKAVQAFGVFTCTAEVVLVAGETEQPMTLQLAVDVRDKRYELRNACVR